MDHPSCLLLLCASLCPTRPLDRVILLVRRAVVRVRVRVVNRLLDVLLEGGLLQLLAQVQRLVAVYQLVTLLVLQRRPLLALLMRPYSTDQLRSAPDALTRDGLLGNQHMREDRQRGRGGRGERGMASELGSQHVWGISQSGAMFLEWSRGQHVVTFARFRIHSGLYYQFYSLCE